MKIMPEKEFKHLRVINSVKTMRKPGFFHEVLTIYISYPGLETKTEPG